VFSSFNTVVQNHVRSITADTIREQSRYVSLEDLQTEGEPENLALASVDLWRSSEALEDIRHRLCTLRTICTRENELHAQRWLVRSLIATEFAIPRHEAGLPLTWT
jgi:hypothetical protein